MEETLPKPEETVQTWECERSDLNLALEFSPEWGGYQVALNGACGELLWLMTDVGIVDELIEKLKLISSHWRMLVSP